MWRLRGVGAILLAAHLGSYGLSLSLSFWGGQRPSFGAVRLLLPIVKLTIYLSPIVHGRDGEMPGDLLDERPIVKPYVLNLRQEGGSEPIHASIARG